MDDEEDPKVAPDTAAPLLLDLVKRDLERRGVTVNGPTKGWQVAPQSGIDPYTPTLVIEGSGGHVDAGYYPPSSLFWTSTHRNNVHAKRVPRKVEWLRYAPAVTGEDGKKKKDTGVWVGRPNTEASAVDSIAQQVRDGLDSLTRTLP
jgi:hypothetical protein